MTDPDRPTLSLGQPPGNLKNRTGPIPRLWLWVFLTLHVVLLGCLVMLVLRPVAQGGSAPAASGPADIEQLRESARQLEERSLYAQAARAWEVYLQSDPATPERAEILYRVGSLYIDAEQFDEAAAALVRSEVAAEDDTELEAKIGPKLVDCQRRLGRYGEVGRELSRQVEAGADAADRPKVLATLAGEELTEADLDRMIQRQVDRVLALQGGPGDVSARQAILRQFSSPEARQRMLQELLQTELFCRRARELKLDREEEFLDGRRHLEESLLAGRFMSSELEKIRPTEVDVQSYYKGNQERYQEPESIEVRSIELGEMEGTVPLLDKIKSPDGFRKLAAKRPSPGAPATAAERADAPPRTIDRGRLDPLLGDVEALFDLSEGEWTKDPHVHNDKEHLVLVEKKNPVRIPPLAEVRERVEADYVRVKQQELAEQLFRDLLARYDVRIMPPAEGSDEPTEPNQEEAP